MSDTKFKEESGKKNAKEKSQIVSLLFVVFFVTFSLFSFIRTALSVDIEGEDFKILLRMTEVLGAVYYLDSLCGIKNAISWREDMDSVLSSYKFDQSVKRKMIYSFNDSFNSYKKTYRSCNTRAEAVAREFYNEGSILAQKIATSK